MTIEQLQSKLQGLGWSAIDQSRFVAALPRAGRYVQQFYASELTSVVADLMGSIWAEQVERMTGVVIDGKLQTAQLSSLIKEARGSADYGFGENIVPLLADIYGSPHLVAQLSAELLSEMDEVLLMYYQQVPLNILVGIIAARAVTIAKTWPLLRLLEAIVSEREDSGVRMALKQALLGNNEIIDEVKQPLAKVLNQFLASSGGEVSAYSVTKFLNAQGYTVPTGAANGVSELLRTYAWLEVGEVDTAELAAFQAQLRELQFAANIEADFESVPEVEPMPHHLESATVVKQSVAPAWNHELVENTNVQRAHSAGPGVDGNANLERLLNQTKPVGLDLNKGTNVNLLEMATDARSQHAAQEDLINQKLEALKSRAG